MVEENFNVNGQFEFCFCVKINFFKGLVLMFFFYGIERDLISLS